MIHVENTLQIKLFLNVMRIFINTCREGYIKIIRYVIYNSFISETVSSLGIGL